MPCPLLSRVRIAFLVVLMTNYAASANGDTDPPPRAIHPLGVIRTAVAGSRQRLESLQVEYTGEGLAHGSSATRSSVLRRVVTAAGVRRRIESWHSTTSFPEELDIGHNLLVYDGSRLVDLKPPLVYCETFNRTASRFARKTRCEYILECTGWWPPGDDPKTPFSDIGLFLHEALADPQCRVLPEQEEVGGAWCHVIERPGVDRLWFDPAIGFSLRRRRWSPRNSGFLPTDYQLSDHVEVAPGVWFPRRLRRIIYETPTMADRPGRVESDATAVVTRIAVNRDFGADLAIVIPPGTCVLNSDTGEFSMVPGGDLSQLDRIIEREASRGAVYARLGLAPGWPSPGSGGSVWWLLAGAFVFVLSGVGLAFVIDGVANLRDPARREPRHLGSGGDQIAVTIPPGATSL
jgi:hypothetical protein